MSLSEIPEDRVIDLTDQIDPAIPDVSESADGVDFMEKLLKDKKQAPSKFESYWEKDENDIDLWTDVLKFAKYFHKNTVNTC